MAKQLFEQKGYEATTTREIAEAAEIATGTLFLYVKDKAELLILIYTDALEEITANSFATLTEDMPFLDALMHIFGPCLRFYEQHLENARHFLKELLFHSGGNDGHQLSATQKEGIIERLVDLVRHAQERGEIRQQLDPQLAARSFFAMYFAAVIAWLGNILLSDADVLAGADIQDQLRAVFDLQIRGMLP